MSKEARKEAARRRCSEAARRACELHNNRPKTAETSAIRVS
jgi:hypothetical protein